MNERRVTPRMPCAEPVQLQWSDEAGRARMAIADLTDISLTGASLQLERPIPLRTQLRFTFSGQELTGTVRHCVLRELGYAIGLEFDPGCQWNERARPRKQLAYPRKRSTRAADPVKSH